MSDLISYKLCDLYELSSGISTKPEQAGHGHPFCSFSTIFNNPILPDELPDLMDTSEEERVTFSIKEGDAFLTRTSETVDELAMSSVAVKDYPDATFSGFAKRLRPRKSGVIYPKYMAYFFRSPYFRKIVTNKAVMTLRASFNEDIFNDIVIEVPNYEEQVRIGDCFFLIEQKIRNNKSICSDLESIARLLYDYWFVQFDFPDENGRPYKSSGGKMVWNDELKREIPEGWKTKNFLDFCNWESASQPPKSEFVYEPRKGYVRFIQNRDYSSDENITYIPLKKTTKLCDEYDILVDKYGDKTAGKIRYGIKGAYNVALGKITSSMPYSQEYLRAFLSSDLMFQYLHNACLASTRSSMNETVFIGIIVPIPDEKILIKYEKIMHNIIENILNLKQENRELVSLRGFLLPMLINGQIKIEDVKAL